MMLQPAAYVELSEGLDFAVSGASPSLRASQVKEQKKRSVATRIRRARSDANLSQQQLAARIGVQRSAVAQWESPYGSWPCTEHLASVAVETRVQFEWLSTGRGTRHLDDKVQTAVLLDDFAQNEIETRMLELLRQLSQKNQRKACALVELLAV